MQAIFDTVAHKRAPVKLVITIRRLRFVSEVYNHPNFLLWW